MILPLTFQSSRLVPLAAIRLHYTQAQIESDDPVLQGAFATVTTELYLAMSIVSLVSAFLKSFMAVYVDGNGFAYTESASVSAQGPSPDICRS
jgi:hypothetical protein